MSVISAKALASSPPGLLGSALIPREPAQGTEQLLPYGPGHSMYLALLLHATGVTVFSLRKLNPRPAYVAGAGVTENGVRLFCAQVWLLPRGTGQRPAPHPNAAAGRSPAGRRTAPSPGRAPSLSGSSPLGSCAGSITTAPSPFCSSPCNFG